MDNNVERHMCKVYRYVICMLYTVVYWFINLVYIRLGIEQAASTETQTKAYAVWTPAKFNLLWVGQINRQQKWGKIIL